MRMKAKDAGKIAKLYDFKCTKCGEVFEEMATWDQIKNNEIKHCGVPAEKVLSAPRVDSHGAASWRR